MIMNEKLVKYQKLYLLALRLKFAKTGDKVFNSGNEYKHVRSIISKFNDPNRYKNKPCRGRGAGGWVRLTAGTERVKGERKLEEEYSAKPEGDDPREASSNNCVVMLGHFPKSISQQENDPSSEPVELSKPVNSWRTPNTYNHIDDGSMGGGRRAEFLIGK